MSEHFDFALVVYDWVNKVLGICPAVSLLVSFIK